VLLLNNLLPRRPTDHIRCHCRPKNGVLPLQYLSLANCTSLILRDFLNITGLKRLCEPAKFEIFAKFQVDKTIFIVWVIIIMTNDEMLVDYM
jgi:hypothetical protein